MKTESIQKLINPVVEGLGYELVDVRFVTDMGRRVLRVFVDALGDENGEPKKVSIGDCEKISREIETLLEVEGAVNERYLLEVSSPGLDRPLTKEAHFLKYLGKKATVMTVEPIEARRNYKGTLKGFEHETLTIEVDGKDYRIPFRMIEKANLVYEF